MHHTINILAICSWILGSSLSADTIESIISGATIITMEPGSPAPIESGWMTISDTGHILEVGSGELPTLNSQVTRIDASGKIIIPGFISAHSHLWSAPFRCIASESNLYDWIAACHFPFYPYYQEGDFYDYTLYGGLDFLSHGITACYNWVSNNGYKYEHWMEHFDAQLDMEQRFILGWAMDSDETDAVNRERLEAFMEKADSLKESHPNMLGISLSAIGLLRGDTDIPFREGSLMRDYNLDAQVHYLEAPNVKHQQHNEFEILKASGMLCEQLHFAHFIHTTDKILEESIDAGVRMVWNPLSNGRLASGLADIPKYRRAGLRIGMGLDGQASGDISDPFENMRMGLYAIRMKYESAQVLTPYRTLAMHTIESAEMLNVADRIGSLEPGKFADFLIMDPRNPDCGPIFDAYATVVMVMNSRNLSSVFVGGKEVYSNDTFTNHDFNAIRDRAYKRVERMLGQLKADGKPVPTPTYLNHYYEP